MLPAGTILADRYRLEEIIGVGGMGVVYRAQDLELDTGIAIKLLRTDTEPDEQTLARFRREVLLARQVTHPNVVRLHDLGKDGNTLFLTMDHVEGRTLRDRLADGPLSIEQAVRLGMEIADALSAAHDRGIVHRDLKPGNILIDHDGRARLLDFGIARAMDQENVTVAGEVVGTPAYLSPEQVRGEPATAASDIFTLGLILCEALTGRLPQGDGTLDELLGQRATGRTTDPARLRPDLPRWLTVILRNCLAGRPDDRYADAAALRRDLESGQGRHLARRRWRSWALATAGLAGAAVLAIGLLPQLTSPPEIEPGDVHLAVLPLANATGRETMDWARRSLAQSLAESLAEAPQLQVTDSLRVFRLLEDLALTDAVPDSASRRQLFELLDATHLVAGELQATDAGYRIELTLFGLPPLADQRMAVEATAPRVSAIIPELSAEVAERLTGRRQSLPLPPTSDNPQALAHFDRGTALLARHETVAAIEELQQSVAADAEFAAAWTHLATALAAAGHYDRAVDSAETAAALLADHGGRLSLEARATLAELEGRLEQAESLLYELVRQYPGDTRARIRLADLYIDQGRFDPARKALQHVVDNEAQNARAWFLLGKAAIMSGDPGRAAEDYLVRALVIENRSGNIQGRGEVVNALGIAHLQLGNLVVAADYFSEAAELREQAGDRRGTAATRANLAHLSMLLGDFDQAHEQLALAIADRQALGDQGGMADLYAQQGVVAEEAGQFQAALDSYREALRLYETLGYGRALADAYNNVAFAYFMLGEYDNARQFNRSALDRLDADERPAGRIMALETRGYLETGRGDWDAALRAFVESLELSRELGQPASEAVARGGIGLVAMGQGRFAAALESLEAALEIVAELGDRRGELIYQLKLAELDLQAGRHQAAADRIDPVAAELGAAAGAMVRTDAHRLAGLVARATGDHEAARSQLQSAREIAEHSGMEIHALKARLALAAVDGKSDWDPLLVRAERAGDALVLLDALELAGLAALDRGSLEQAAHLARRGLRPPARVSPRAGNWRLHWLQARAAAGAGEEANFEAARHEIDRLVREMPEDWVAGFVDALPEELRDVQVRAH